MEMKLLGKKKFVLYSQVVFLLPWNPRKNRVMFLKKIREKYTIAP
jgi:hypothetical protein